MKQIQINNIDDLLQFVEEAASTETLIEVIKQALKTTYVVIGNFTLKEYKEATKEHILTYWKDRQEFEKPLFIVLPSDILPGIKKTYLNN